MFDILLIISVVVALTQLIKMYLPNKYLPLSSLVLGIIIGFVYMDGDIKTRIMYGLMIGLSAAGLFDQSKIITKK